MVVTLKGIPVFNRSSDAIFGHFCFCYHPNRSRQVRLTRFFANLTVSVLLPSEITPMLPSVNLSAMAFLRSSAVAFSFKPKSTPPTIFVFGLTYGQMYFYLNHFHWLHHQHCRPQRTVGIVTFCKSATVTAELSKALSFSARAFSAFTSSSLGSCSRSF